MRVRVFVFAVTLAVTASTSLAQTPQRIGRLSSTGAARPGVCTTKAADAACQRTGAVTQAGLDAGGQVEVFG
jgi:hypothetical protein